MEQPALECGGLYSLKGDNRPVRVLLHDEQVTFYDCYWPELGKWMLCDNLNRATSFYCMGTGFFVKNATRTGSRPLTELERMRIRPDLPCSFGRIADFRFANSADTPNFSDPDFEVLAGNKIVLLAKTARRKVKATRVVTIDTLENLLREARTLQEAAGHLDLRGIGFFRSGVRSRLPSYYIGGYESDLEVQAQMP